MEKYTIYDVPPTNLSSQEIKDMAIFLTRRKVRLLFVLTFLVSVTGLTHSILWNSTSVTSRYGSIIICIGILSAAYQLSFSSLMNSVENIALKIFTNIEMEKSKGEMSELDAKAIAYKRVSRVLPLLAGAINARLISLSLMITAFGTLYSGFMDILVTAIR